MYFALTFPRDEETQSGPAVLLLRLRSRLSKSFEQLGLVLFADTDARVLNSNHEIECLAIAPLRGLGGVDVKRLLVLAEIDDIGRV